MDIPPPVWATTEVAIPIAGSCFYRSAPNPFAPAIQIAEMVGLEYSSGKVRAVVFLLWTLLGKPTPGAAPDPWADMAIWTGLTSEAGGCSKAGPNSPMCARKGLSYSGKFKGMCVHCTALKDV